MSVGGDQCVLTAWDINIIKMLQQNKKPKLNTTPGPTDYSPAYLLKNVIQPEAIRAGFTSLPWIRITVLIN